MCYSIDISKLIDNIFGFKAMARTCTGTDR